MKNHYSLLVIAVSLPFILWYVCDILPTFDDFTSMQSPWWTQIADPGYIMPDFFRRPFDFIYGSLVGSFPALFPTLNHVAIILGHTANTVLVFCLCRRLQLWTSATNMATLFFFFSPATLGATLACDGLNQTYAQLWGLLSLWSYIRGLQHSSNKWLFCVAMAALTKENGLAWAVVPPVFALAFGLVTLRKAVTDAGKGILLAGAYLVILTLVIHFGIAGIEYPDEYSETTLISHLKDLVQLLAYTWVPLDYMSAVYAPTRNLAIVVITALMALPFLAVLAFLYWKRRELPISGPVRTTRLSHRLLLLTACFFTLSSPHLFTVVSIMHNYAALSIAAVIIATILTPSTVHSRSGSRLVMPAFVLFLAAALFTDIHHYVGARDSGLLGKRLAMQAIEHAVRPVQRALVITIDDPEQPRYSSFCVRPADAFAWGLSVRHYSGYLWKTAISDTTFNHYDPALVKAVAVSALHAGNDAVWVVGHKADSLTIFSAPSAR